jgi:methylmalonyl-CoA mutase N-terminal domain/subunit
MKQACSRSGIPLKAVYGPEDLRDFEHESRRGTPGAYPYTRGRRADAVGGWIQRELSGEGEPSRSNDQLKYLLSQGQIGLDVIGDSPTMAFLDPDHPMGEIGGMMRMVYGYPYDPHGLIEQPF